MRITMIGSGNVATHMAAALLNAGHKIIQIYSPTYQNAALLAYHVHAEAISDIAAINTQTDLFIISIKDDAINSMAQSLSVYKILTVHTSGATDINSISSFIPLAGVFYPLQTFSKFRELNFFQVPVCVEGANDAITEQLEELAQTISNAVYRVGSNKRKILHLAAVFACNFPNNLYAIAQQILSRHQLSFDLLKPLIMETAQKVQNHFPADVQTGPAVRNDENTINFHLNLLADDTALQNLYLTLSQSIIKMELSQQQDK
jgi:predicted short-subunit dehydrogenase-like oxidoreductase (DUF2520 family)